MQAFDLHLFSNPKNKQRVDKSIPDNLVVYLETSALFEHTFSLAFEQVNFHNNHPKK
jgi:hypothetical protein